MEAFTDGVLAIIVSIMVLEMKAPQGTEIGAMRPLVPVLLSYVLSFVYVGIYWNNHHHMLHAARHVNGAVLWANLHLLFWLSLTPFVTAWVGENHLDAVPTALYGVVLLMASIAYFILQRTIIAAQPNDSTLAQAVGTDWKGKLSPFAYLVAIGCAFVEPWISAAIYTAIALTWIVPDRRIESAIHRRHDETPDQG